jgi:hypothetical protein
MGADGQRFDEGELVVAEAVPMDQALTGYCQIFDHAAIDVDAADLYLCAAVGVAVSAGNAVAAVEIGDDGDGFAGLKSRGLIKVDEVAREFMAEDPRVFEIGLGAFEGVEVRAADADAADPDDGFAGSGERSAGGAIFEITGLYAD